jgi:hypothetical protein
MPEACKNLQRTFSWQKDVAWLLPVLFDKVKLEPNCLQSCRRIVIQSSQIFLLLWTGWPDWANFGLWGDCLLWAVVWKSQKQRKFWRFFFHSKLLILKKWSGYKSGDFFTNSSGHPGRGHLADSVPTNNKKCGVLCTCIGHHPNHYINGWSGFNTLYYIWNWLINL